MVQRCFLLVAMGLLAGSGLATPTRKSPPETGGARLLDQVFKRPGSWNQMCFLPGPVAFDVPVPVFRSVIADRYFNLGVKEIAELQASRESVVPPLVERLRAIDLTAPPKKVLSKKESIDLISPLSGLRPDWLNSLHLQVIEQLNAVEALHELLRLEAQLHAMLLQSEKSSASPLPPLPLDSPGLFEKPGGGETKGAAYYESAAYQRDLAVFTARVFHREILGTISLLLKNERAPQLKALGFEELRQSERARLKKETERELATKTKEHEKLQQELGDDVKLDRSEIDGLTKQLRYLSDEGALVQFEVPYDEAVRGEVALRGRGLFEKCACVAVAREAGMPKRSVQ